MTITRLHTAMLSEQQQQQLMTATSASPAPSTGSPLKRRGDARESSTSQEVNYQDNHPQEDSSNSALDASIMTDSEISIQVTNWIKANYVKERDHNVPRKNMFEHYKTYCTANQLSPVNSATFGKLLRIVFPDLKTRRLGVRGQSKYHYCGIRVRTERLVDSGAAVVDTQATTTTTSTVDHRTATNDNNNGINDLNSINHDSNNGSHNSPMAIPTRTELRYNDHYTYHQQQQQHYHQPDHIHDGHLPTFQIPSNIPAFRTVDHGMLLSFTTLYEQHCRDVLELVTTNQVHKVKSFVSTFYQDMPGSYKNLMRSVPELSEAVWRWDCTLYDTMIERFLPTVNQRLSEETVRNLHTFTRELKEYIEASLAQYPSYLCQRKLDVARIFAAKFRRQLSLNFAAQNAASILNSSPHIAHMRESWSKLEVDAILDQTLWVCDCDTNEIKLICVRIFELLNSTSSIENWKNWIHNIVEKYLIKGGSVPSSISEANQYLHCSKQLLLKWNFYVTLIMKDITLQRTESFGSFQTLRLFLDDYILYLVEESIAQMNHNLMQSLQQQQQQRPNYYHHPPAGPTPSTSTSTASPSASQGASPPASSVLTSSSAYHHIGNKNNNAASATPISYRQ